MAEGGQVQHHLGHVQRGPDPADQQHRSGDAPGRGRRPGQHADQQDREAADHPDRRELHQARPQDRADLPAITEGEAEAGQQHEEGRTAEGDHQMPGGPPQTPDRVRQHRFRPARRLLAVQAQHRRHDVQGRDQAEHADHRRQERVRQLGLAAHPLEDPPRTGVVADQVGRALGHAAVDDPGEEEADAPAQHTAPLQPPGQGARAAQAAGRRTGPGGQEAHADVPAAGQPVGHRALEQNRPGEQRQHPPAFVRVRPQVLQPSQRRRPRQHRRTSPSAESLGGAPIRRRVARCAQHERGAQHRRRQPTRQPRALRQLGHDRRHRREDHPDPGDPEPQGQRPDRTLPGQSGRHQQRQDRVRDRRRQQGRRQRGPAAHHPGRHQFLTATLLLVPGVPYDDQQAHHGGQGARVDADPPGRQSADRVVEDRADHRAQRGVGRHLPDQVGAFGRGAVQALQRVRHGEDHQGVDPDPHRDHQPVAAQREPQQCARTGQLA